MDDRPVVLDGMAAFRFVLGQRHAHDASGKLEDQEDHAPELFASFGREKRADMVAEHRRLAPGFGDI